MKKVFKIVPLIVLTLALAGCTSEGENIDSRQVSQAGPAIDLSKQASVVHDWEEIDIAGGDVTHRFAFKNTFDGPIRILAGETSCMCTSAVATFADGTDSPRFGMHDNPSNWSHTVLPGDEFSIEVRFDPMAHGPDATGNIRRTAVFGVDVPAEISRTHNPRFPLELTVMANVLASADFEQLSNTDAASKTASNLVADESRESGTANHDEMGGHGHADLAPLEISLYEAVEQVDAEGVVFLDVREESELLETGVVPGSVHIPLGSLSQNSLNESGISQKDNIVVVCRSGNRSLQGAKIISSLGYPNVKSMQGGVVHWQEDGFELIPWDKAATKNNEQESGPENGPDISFDKTEFDFGSIGPNSIQQTTFTVFNRGDEVLEIGDITTSCMCTEARIDQKSIRPGESAILTVVFDPNVHEEPKDRFKRTVFLQTNDSKMPEAEVNIWMDIDEEAEDIL